LKIVLTAVGCPGGVTMIRALRDNGEREIEIVGTDMRPEAAGRFFVDRFYAVPSGRSSGFIPRMLEIVQREQPDLIVPQSSYEVQPFAEHRAQFEAQGAPVVVAGPQSVKRASDKMLTYEALAGTEVPYPRSIRCSDLEAFLSAVYELGYPEKKVCFKPPDSKGARGFRVITNRMNRLDILLRERSGSVLMTLEEATDVLGEADTFPELMVMEFTEGKEHTVDVFCRDGRVLTGFVKTREAVKAGLAMYFETVERPDLRRYGEIISERLGLDYFANIQFKGGQLLEVNPRVSTFVHQEDFNMPYLGIKYILGEIGESELRQASKRVRTSRRTVRYYDQVFYDTCDIEDEPLE
jgi:carbamoyl-phosphate synthase large subunit